MIPESIVFVITIVKVARQRGKETQLRSSNNPFIKAEVRYPYLSFCLFSDTPRKTREAKAAEVATLKLISNKR